MAESKLALLKDKLGFRLPTKVVIGCLLAFLVVGLALVVFGRSHHGQSLSVDAIAAKVARYGTIVAHSDVGRGGLTAWTVSKGGRHVMLYTTPDGEALISGVVWDLNTAANLTDKFGITQPPSKSLPKDTRAAPLTTAAVASARGAPDEYIINPRAHTGAAMDGEFKGEIPESMKTVDALAGIKEGQGGVGDTVYIIFDPRCAYCSEAYGKTRELVKSKGKTIKWIPTAALGKPEQVAPLIATLLLSKDADILRRIMSKHEKILTDPTQHTMQAMTDNLGFMFAAFKANTQQEAGVPVAFFIDHRTGKPRMLSGVSDTHLLTDIFGAL